MAFTPHELSKYLRTVHTNASALDRIKIAYRPFVCPFTMLIDDCSNSKTIVDIGCGSGQFLLLLSKYTNAIRLGGIEISPALVNNARALLGSQQVADVNIEIYNGMEIPDFIREFDTVTLIDVFHHIKKEYQGNFLVNLYRKMRPGAKLIFKDINAAHPYVLLNKLHDLFLGGGIGHEISLSHAMELMRRAGFSVSSSSKKLMLWYPHYTIICIK
jgi:cyclopropane fatty-acyl-phospholipid synthase-like methyltransferase